MEYICDSCKNKANKIFSYLCESCNNNTGYCEECNHKLEIELNRKTFICLFCNEYKRIKTINVLQNTKDDININNKNLNLDDYYEKNLFNKPINNFKKISPLKKKFEILENLSNLFIQKNSYTQKQIDESIIIQNIFEKTFNLSKGGISNLSINDKNENDLTSKVSQKRSIINSTLFNDSSHNFINNPNHGSSGWNTLLNAFSPIKNHKYDQKKIIESASIKSKNTFYRKCLLFLFNCLNCYY